MNTMLRRAALIAVSALALAGAPARASDDEHLLTREQVRALDRQIYGWQLMTRRERDEYRERLRELRTVEERERFIAEHRAAMQARAQARGVALPGAPAATAGAGHGPGSGGGAGAGSGGGSGGGAGGAGGGGGAGAGGGGAGGGGGGAGGGGGGGGGGR